MDRGAWQAAVHGVTDSWTRLNNFHFFTLLAGAPRQSQGEGEKPQGKGRASGALRPVTEQANQSQEEKQNECRNIRRSAG